MTPMKIFFLILITLLFTGCSRMPDGVEPITAFDADRYLGKWYEIARLDHAFERGLTHVSAEYSLRDDGGIRVINRGFSQENNDWKEAEGKAYFVESEDIGYLKVSFFGPFYGSYVIFDLDKDNYQYSFITGNSTSYLWLLARTPSVSQDVIDNFISQAKAFGFNTDELIFVDHN